MGGFFCGRITRNRKHELHEREKEILLIHGIRVLTKPFPQLRQIDIASSEY